MRLRDAVLKHSLGRCVLHHLDSTYQVEVNDRACSEIEHALSDPTYDGPGRKLLQRLQDHQLVEDAPFEPLPRRVGSELVSVELEPMGRCNLACRHCFVNFSRAQMTEQVFAAALQGACALGAVELTFNGGEPLLHPEVPRWLKAAREAGLRTLLFTNATLVTDELAGELAAAKLARATVSLDGFEEVHDALRGRGAFVRTVDGIRALVRARLSVHVTTVAHPGNEAQLSALRKYCSEELGVRGIRVSTVAPMGKAAQAPELQLPLERFLQLYEDEKPPPARGCTGMLSCRAGVDKLYISAQGKVHGCHLFEEVATPLGTLPGQPLAEIHRSVGQVELLSAFDPQRLPECADCPALAECGGGCRARAWQLTRNPWGPDPVSCRKRQQPFPRAQVVAERNVP